MKLKAPVMAAALLAAVLAAAGHAQEEGVGNGPRFELGDPGIERGMRRGDGALFHRGARGNPRRLFARLDADEDSLISFDEYTAPLVERADRLFARLDRDDDGRILGEETAPPERPARERRVRRFQIDEEAVRECVSETLPEREPPVPGEGPLAELGSDGEITLDELVSVLEEQAGVNFDRLDADGDGFLSREDLQARRAAQREIRLAVRDCLSTVSSEG